MSPTMVSIRVITTHLLREIIAYLDGYDLSQLQCSCKHFGSKTKKDDEHKNIIQAIVWNITQDLSVAKDVHKLIMNFLQPLLCKY